ncbi:uracil-DNA glycosylase [Undibacterium sp. SXout11W]|uniref:uracil-DNA glycosylase n=1 Tax=Undibacterium sp. SXout11W TaxID=3413050 RepID=UPI003BF2F62E
MYSNQATARIKMLTEMGIGPVWLPRYAEPTNKGIDVSVPVDSALDNIDAPTLPVMAASMVDVIGDTKVHETAFMDEADPAWFDQTPVSDALSLTSSVAAVQLVSDMTWGELEEAVASCRACGLCEGRQKTVFGVGARTANWLFVGEGPGYHENIQGEPFVGAAGQLLDNMLLALGVRRGDRTYIANVVKCRSTDEEGKDRPPSVEDIASCLPYLKRQIALIQPQVIVALGKTAAIALTGSDSETPVAQLRNAVHRVMGIPMVATFHPAYLLRKPLEKSKAWQDLCLAQRALDGTSM